MPSSRGLMGIISLFGFRGLASSPITVSDTDSGIGVDTEVLVQSIEDTDSGVGVEGTEVLSITLLDTDLGVGVEVDKSLSNVLSDTEVGTGVDIEVPAGGYQTLTPGSDVGVGAETASVAVTLSDTDSGQGSDSSSLKLGKQLDIVVTSIEDYLDIKVDITSSVDE